MLSLLHALVLGVALGGAPQDPSRTLVVVVADQTDAVLPAARVTVSFLDGGRAVEKTATTDERGEATLDAIAASLVSMTVEYPGFEPYQTARLMLSRSVTRARVHLRLPSYAEEVTVRRDRRETAVDRRGDGFSTVLSPLQLAQLSDDPETLRRQLEQLAGPGAMFRIDGFRGGRFPSKQEIARVRIVWNTFAAEYHEGGVPMVEIATKPGEGALQLSASVRAQPGSLSAGVPLATQPAAGNRASAYVSLSGPVRPQRSSFTLFIEGQQQTDPVPITAAGAAPSADSPVRESRQLSVVARFGQKLPSGWSLRGESESRLRRSEHLGVGALDLPEREYTGRGQSHSLAVTASGPLKQVAFLDLRVRGEINRSQLSPLTEAPAIIINGSMRGGGAQVGGTRRQAAIEFGQDLDIPLRNHAFRLGLELTGDRLRGEDLTNRQGTFVFPDLAAWARKEAATYTRRVGDPTLHASDTTFGVYIQDDVRLRKGLSASFGLRQEDQRLVHSRWHLAPRLGLSWAPFADGKTLLSAGFGRYFEWLPLSTLETVARLDGMHGRDILIQTPTYPIVVTDGARLLPATRYALAPTVDLPRNQVVSLALQREMGPVVTARLSYERRRGNRALWGRNLNPPGPDGTRPDGASANVIEVDSAARSRSHAVRVNLSGRIPHLGVTLIGNYTFRREWNESDGAFDVPADPTRPDAEWGPSSDDVRHQANLFAVWAYHSRVFLSLSLAGSSGVPYTITTGDDENGDGIFNDRPPGVGRNTRRQAGQWQVHARLGWNVRNTAAAAGSADSGASPSPSKRPALQLFVEAQNLLNAPGWSSYSGVLSSPLFGRPTSAMPPRRIDVGVVVRY